jgi:hypothetical protein
VNGDAITEPGPRGERITDADFILMLNAHSDTVSFMVPASFGAPGVTWEVLVDTGVAASGTGEGVQEGPRGRVGSTVGRVGSDMTLDVGSRTIVVLRGAKPNGG